MKSALFKAATTVIAAALLAGCGGVRAHRGTVLDTELASAIQVGVDNKQSVAKTLGRPSFTGQFSENDWYYFSRDTQTLAFRDPRVMKQTILHVRFDQAGNVAAVNTTGKEQIASVDPYGKKTPTLGRKRGFFEELFGNIGTVGSGMGGPGGAPGGSSGQ